MPEIHSKPSNDAYRDNWDRIFKPKVTVREALEYCGIPVEICEGIPKDEIWLVSDDRIDKIVNIGVPING